MLTAKMNRCMAGAQHRDDGDFTLKDDFTFNVRGTFMGCMQCCCDVPVADTERGGIMIVHSADQGISERHSIGKLMMGALPAPSTINISSRTKYGPYLRQSQSLSDSGFEKILYMRPRWCAVHLHVAKKTVEQIGGSSWHSVHANPELVALFKV